ncbi:hypothetical protein EDC01DRAFT_494369 [Geopyxis carbonaria]|nr:hypothetical protein EDC01DRAFT_494369 [Geopyxis carbonaria]
MNPKIIYDIVVILIAVLFVSLRIWVSFRTAVRRPRVLVLGDALVLFALAMSVSVVVLHVWFLVAAAAAKRRGEAILPGLKVPVGLAVVYLKIIHYFSFAYVTVIWCAKASLLCTYHTVSPRLARPLQRTVAVCTVFTCLMYPTRLLLMLLWCRPIARFWSLNTPGDACMVISILPLATLGTSIHLATDLVVMGTGVLVIRTLQLGRRERVTLGLVFAIGACTIVTAVVRFGLQLRLIRVGDLVQTQRLVEMIMTTAVAEGLSALVAVCLPSLRVFLRARGMGSGGGSGSGGGETGEGASAAKRSDRIYVDTYVSVVRDGSGYESAAELTRDEIVAEEIEMRPPPRARGRT